MAKSPAHKLGQIIGDELETAVHEPLSQIAREFGLYLDYRHPRAARGEKKKVAWTDRHGNTHELDYVLEDGGSAEKRGHPRAFIETAWRRYTKHSRNKAQEIQAAITPLADTFRQYRPFLGVVLGGIFTNGALDQFRSHNFSIAYCPYETVVRAFANEGIDVSSDEDTSEAELQCKIDAFEQLTTIRRERIARGIRELHADQFSLFFKDLRRCLGRFVQHVFVLTLSGNSHKFDFIKDAIRFITEHDQAEPASDFVRYELNIRYSDGDEIRADCSRRAKAVAFLRLFENDPGWDRRSSVGNVDRALAANRKE